MLWYLTHSLHTLLLLSIKCQRSIRQKGKLLETRGGWCVLDLCTLRGRRGSRLTDRAGNPVETNDRSENFDAFLWKRKATSACMFQSDLDRKGLFCGPQSQPQHHLKVAGNISFVLNWDPVVSHVLKAAPGPHWRFKSFKTEIFL